MADRTAELLTLVRIERPTLMREDSGLLTKSLHPGERKKEA